MAAPSVAAPTRPGINTIVLENPLARAVKYTAREIAEMGYQAASAFRSKPGQTFSYALGWTYLALIFIIMLPVPWFTARSWPAGPVTSVASFTLLSQSVCYDINIGRQQFNPSAACTTVFLKDSAMALDYFRSAGGAAFALLFFALLTGLLGQMFLNMHRRNELANIHPRLHCLRASLLPPMIHSVSLFFVALSWIVYFAVVNTQYNAGQFVQAALIVGNLRNANFSAGPALSVIASACCLACVLVGVLYRKERDRVFTLPMVIVPSAGPTAPSSEEGLLPPAVEAARDSIPSKYPVEQETKGIPSWRSSLSRTRDFQQQGPGSTTTTTTTTAPGTGQQADGAAGEPGRRGSVRSYSSANSAAGQASSETPSLPPPM